MKYSPKTYAAALMGALKNVPENSQSLLLRRFLEIITKNGDWAGIRKILSAVSEFSVRESGGRMVKLEFARAVPADFISKLSSVFRAEDYIEVAINTQLVAGVRLTIDGEKEFDGSLQKKLNRLFS
ncbi:MAG: F0F1 ATP synthase subunit delta [Candidatus Colwellbacteria bacterium]|nr:F0F1 ATP synthase subunit delta [Candidatus Colwellbacteria bacterium]